MNKKDEELLDEAAKYFAEGDRGERNKIIGSVQKAGQKWLPNDVFKKHFEMGKEIANDRGDDEISMQFWVYGSPMSGYKESEESLSPIMFADWSPESQKQKQQLMMGLGMKIADEWGEDVMLTTIVHVSEAWAVQRNKGDDVRSIVPSEQDDRIEIALVHAMSMDQRISFWQGKILKDSEGSFTGYEDILSEEHNPENPKTFSDKESYRDYLSEWILLGYSIAKQQKGKEEAQNGKTK